MSDRARATFARTLATALLLAAAAAAQDVVTARLRWESGYVRKTHSHVVKSGAEPPKVGPSGLTGGTYGTLPLLGRKVLVAFGDGRFWVDSDADGSFEGERPFYTEGTSWELVRTVVVDDEPIVLRFYSSGLFLRYSPRSYRVGTVVLAGRLRRIALSDHDGDLLFTAKDHLYVDVDGDGELDEIKPGRPVRMGDRGFVASIADPRGGAVEFAKAPAPPPPAPRKWVPLSMWRRSRRASKPSETLAELKRSYAALDSQQFTGRYDLVDKVGRVQSDEAFRFLWKIAHDDPEEYVRGYAVKAMRYEAYRSHRKKIRTLLKSRDPEIVAAALEVLDDPDDAEQEALFLKFVRNKDATIVRAAAHALAARRTDAGRAALVRVFERAGDGSLRYEAYDHLRYWREGPPVELALRAATDSYDRLRAAALEDLWKLDHPDTHKLALEAAEGTPSTTERYTIIDVLKRFDDRKSIHAVIAMARSSGAEVRKRVLEALRPLRSPGALAELVAALRDKDPAVRALAAEVLAGVDDADAEITKALARQAKREKDEAARDTLLGALGDQGDPSTIPLLLKLAKRKNIAAIRALARFGLGEPRVRAYFLGLLESRKWENRVYALDAAGLSGQESLVNRVAANLDHGVWQVRLAAVEALGKLRFKASIPPLIERLGPEEHKRVRATLAESLWRLTGQTFMDFQDPWRRWWAKNGGSFRIPKYVPERAPLAPGSTVASFFGLPVGSGRVVFVIDKSGSMSAFDSKSDKSRLEMAVAEVLAAVGRLKDRDSIGIVFFDSSALPWKKELVKLTRSRRTSLKKYLEKQRPSGGTNIYDPLAQALGMKDVDTVFLLSDGVPGSGTFVETKDILRAVRRLNQTRRIAIHGIAIGQDSDLLKSLATENGGRYVRR